MGHKLGGPGAACCHLTLAIVLCLKKIALSALFFDVELESLCYPSRQERLASKDRKMTGPGTEGRMDLWTVGSTETEGSKDRWTDGS
ncbi:hypothetical protein ElyMa_004485700 [Elysia marginata]|uniref:Secreted protein n=1 Tax=Elysia marginata TaxID=1093978 RepID=A0AAV4HMG5_9GAST|nr:hypothetical protein ElyMa_004485700 [Elysia marginata]